VAEAVRISHSLKSAGAMAGAAALSDAAARAESRLAAATAVAPSDAQELERLFAAYKRALNDRGLIAA